MKAFKKGASSSCQKTARLAGLMLGKKIPGRSPGERRDNALAELGGWAKLRRAQRIDRLAQELELDCFYVDRGVRRMERRLRGTRFEGSFKAASTFWKVRELRRRRR